MSQKQIWEKSTPYIFPGSIGQQAPSLLTPSAIFEKAYLQRLGTIQAGYAYYENILVHTVPEQRQRLTSMIFILAHQAVLKVMARILKQVSTNDTLDILEKTMYDALRAFYISDIPDTHRIEDMLLSFDKFLDRLSNIASTNIHPAFRTYYQKTIIKILTDSHVYS